jgi:hypothetical protein
VKTTLLLRKQEVVGCSQSSIFSIQCRPEISRKESSHEQQHPHTHRKNRKAIHLIRGERVMLDRDLAKLYDVTTAALNQAVRRNRDRFPEDFMFQLTSDEVVQLNRSQNVIGSEKHRDPLFRPYVLPNRALLCDRVYWEANVQ